MTKLDILIEEIELFESKNLDKKYIYQELLEIRKELNEQFFISGVMLELLCVDKMDNNGLTRYYTYKAIGEDDTHYKVMDNYGDENWFLKEQFDVLT